GSLDSDVTAAPGAAQLPRAVPAGARSPARLFWERFRTDKAALFGGVAIVLLIAIAIGGGPLAARITGHGENDVSQRYRMTDEFGIPKGPNLKLKFWFGADAEGRDLFVRTMYGARASLIVGMVASGIAVLVGLVVGLTAGFFGGFVDTLL